jgi:hypothetical protein
MFREVQQNKVALDIIGQVRQSILEGKLGPPMPSMVSVETGCWSCEQACPVTQSPK